MPGQRMGPNKGKLSRGSFQTDVMGMVEVITVMIKQWQRLCRRDPQLVFVLKGFQATARGNPEQPDLSSELTML